MAIDNAPSAFSVDVSRLSTEAKVTPETPYDLPMLQISWGASSIQIMASNEQLAEIEFAIKDHLNKIPHPPVIIPEESEEVIA